jgi:hypothetical protein
MPGRIEAVTVCVDYADFLAEVVKYNAHVLDRWVIVTTPTDHVTRELCRKHCLDVLLTEASTRNGEFKKGQMIERGLQHLSADCWKLHIDADIVLPANFRKLVKIADLQKDCIYGADRVMVKDWASWKKLEASGWLNGGNHLYHHSIAPPVGYEIGSRWASPKTGYVPIGYFQMWHATEDEWRGTRIKPYPSEHNTACRTDVQMGLQFDRHKREIIPELFVVHLESERCEMGKNWSGRKTKPFGTLQLPTTCPKPY